MPVFLNRFMRRLFRWSASSRFDSEEVGKRLLDDVDVDVDVDDDDDGGKKNEVEGEDNCTTLLAICMIRVCFLAMLAASPDRIRNSLKSLNMRSRSTGSSSSTFTLCRTCYTDTAPRTK